jgi:hypothetical protein
MAFRWSCPFAGRGVARSGCPRPGSAGRTRRRSRSICARRGLSATGPENFLPGQLVRRSSSPSSIASSGCPPPQLPPPPSRPWINFTSHRHAGRQVGTRSDHEGGSGKVEATCCDGNKLFLLAYNRSGRRRTAGLRLAQPCSLDDARIAARRPPAAGRGGGVRRRRSLGGFGDNSGRSHASPRWS